MRDSSTDDSALVAQIAQARTKAFDRLYDRYSRLVFSVALAILRDRALAEEVTLDVFVQVWLRAGTYRSEQGRVSTWLIAITRHRAIDLLRWQKTHPDSDGLSLEATAGPDGLPVREAENGAEISLEGEQVREALDRLPEEQRQALRLAYFRGYTHSQIAEKLGQPLGTVKTRIRLGMQKLRQLLEKE